MNIEDYMKETPVKMKEIIQGADELFAEVRKEKFSRIVVTGSGTSYHSAAQTKKLMQHFLGIYVDVLYPFQIDKETFLDDASKTLLIGISQGGSSYSTYHAMKTGKEAGCSIASMAGTEGALIDEISDFILTVRCGEETAGAKTKGFYCTKLNLTLFALQLAKSYGRISAEDYAAEITQLEAYADQFLTIYEQSLQWVSQNRENLAAAKDIRVIGTKEIYGDTLESALKLLETMRIPVTGYEFEEFVHGIYNAVNEDSTIIILDTGEEGRVETLINVLSDWTNHIYVIGKNGRETPKDLKADFLNHPFYKTYEYIIPVQLVCAYVPQLKGIDPSTPKDKDFHRKLGSKKLDR
ncbi:SIS domain-containing protein [Heyndrickxia coagulans]|uniref:SIS domain-containing protein n=1 Tax=Heyndrickxia coagulans TaxID=1398 RepID=A0AAW7CC70_HEYCO|nr:SIS domain-containing protein [Heyndrickxia coagulans]MDL5039794.1 SIS domain-containing protein [Heyndrickxia coagulans]